MRANLPEREKEILAFWEEKRVYARALEASAEPYILHDGPPFSNGDIHMGHAQNKILKDLVVKFHLLQGRRAVFVPGWDNHGLPTELAAIRSLSSEEKKDPVKVRSACRRTAAHYVEVQREQFIRLGVLGKWEEPYLTMDNEYEATILQTFFELHEQQLIYLARKPVHWCMECRTALAEAEIEYEPHQSPSVYVVFEAGEKDSQAPGPQAFTRALSADQRPFGFLIWTTTPWTLPANVAVALHPDYDYVLAEGLAPKPVVLAADLLEEVSAKLQASPEVRRRFKGRQLEGQTYRRPLSEYSGRVVMGTFVTCKTGTGCVHIAPGHGEEDYHVGRSYDLEILSPVDDAGRFTAEVPKLAGLSVFEANAPICDQLRERGALRFSEQIEHSYPHCWRCHRPVIFRATEQWFMNVQKIKEEALRLVEQVAWIPERSKNRIAAHISARPDWCLSRQRSWGVFIPQAVCPACGHREILQSKREELVEWVRREGSDGWFAKTEIAGLSCGKCGHAPLKPGRDILDVWFDSGSSALAVLEKREDLGFPADLYLEGSDQHRGWFQQSLWVALAARGKAPYRQVLTHGFVVDEQGRKMSKSLGNVVDPQQVISKWGAEILRLFVASADFRSDVRVSYDHMRQMADIYRKIRNTLRFMLGNLYDFSEGDELPLDLLEPVDRFVLQRWASLARETEVKYRRFEFHAVVQLMHEFFLHDLSAFYLDICKDRLYCYPAGHRRRRAAQTVIALLLRQTLPVLAPLISFTAEECWQALRRKGDPESVFLAGWPSHLPSINEDLSWIADLLSLRKEVYKAIEAKRAAKEISDASQAAVRLQVEAPLATEDPDFLREFLRVSDVSVRVGPPAIVVERTTFAKCDRCWNYRPSLRPFGSFHLCPFCHAIMAGKGEEHADKEKAVR